MSSITSEQIIAGLTDPGLLWTTPVITYSVPKLGSQWSTKTSEAGAPGFAYLSASQGDAFRGYITYVGSLIAKPIVEVDDTKTLSQIRIAFTDTPAGVGAYAYYPGRAETDGDIWLGQGMRDFVNGIGNDVGSDRMRTAILHELGHALGLLHPNLKGVIPAEFDNGRYTVMSYTPYPNFTQFRLAVVDAAVSIQTKVVQTDGYM